MSLSKFVITFSLIAFAAIGLAQAQTTCSPDQRKEFFLTAVDKDDTVIENLRAEHLSLKVGGSPATISDVVFQAKPALDLAILIDASVSQEKLLPRIKTVARAFVATVPVEGQDRVAVVSFSDLPSYIQPLTSELAGLGAAIDQVRFDAPVGYIGGGVVVSTRPPPHPDARPGSTSLWDTIGSVTQTLF
ncbi:MAG TPA: hypothetical protein VFR51_02865, partial [Pyrinomonadaceae bacterium]|nr:hypothetical protein [Pyrinomonadaceae bacterium]